MEERVHSFVCDAIDVVEEANKIGVQEASLAQSLPENLNESLIEFSVIPRKTQFRTHQRSTSDTAAIIITPSPMCQSVCQVIKSLYYFIETRLMLFIRSQPLSRQCGL